jgi:hypothetical protein
MSRTTVIWPKVLTSHSWHRLNEHSKKKVYVAGVETMYKGDLHLYKWESTISELDAVLNATEQLHDAINILKGNKILPKIGRDYCKCDLPKAIDTVRGLKCAICLKKIKRKHVH